MNTILKMSGIKKVFAGVIALDDVNLELEKGEIHALIGENGAGKSTLMKILLGMYQRDGGEIEFKGQKINFKSPAEALESGISMIHQEISLVPNMTVAENIWLGREKQFKKGAMIDIRKRHEKTEKLLHGLEIDVKPNVPVKNLSVAEMQLVELARAVSYDADIIIMDEPTSALTTKEVELLYKITRNLAKEGVTSVFISHKLEEIFDICDRVTVLRDGHFIKTDYCKNISNDQLIKMIVGRELKDIYPKVQPKYGDVALEVKHLCKTGVFDDISFEVRSGEILGFAGLMGAGRTEIMRSIFGMERPDSGEIYIHGKKVHIKRPKDAVENGIGMVTEDRLRTGSIYTLSVIGNTTLASLGQITNRLELYSPKKELKEFTKVSGKLSVKYSSPKELIGNLSGGNQQKVIIARWLLKNVDILIMDEPTRGIDVGSKSEIYQLMADLANQGMAIIMISSEMPELLGMSNRIVVVRGGTLVFECSRQEADQETLIAHAFDI